MDRNRLDELYLDAGEWQIQDKDSHSGSLVMNKWGRLFIAGG